MPVEFLDFLQARDADGMRMVVVSGVPSPWGEAAKAIFYLKGIPWKAVRLDPGNDEMFEWTQARSGPVAIYADEAPRSGWAEILLLAERLAPGRALLPVDPLERARVLGLCHEICGEEGLGWARRLQGVHAGLNGAPGFPHPVAQYLADKYGYRSDPASLAKNQRQVIERLEMLAVQLHQQKEQGSRFYSGNTLSALDLYSATFTALFKPLPPSQCAMPDGIREGFESMDEATRRSLDPILLAHRDFVYGEYLELPLTL